MTKNRGSQWRKWDLHIHTPASFHWNGTKRLKDMDATEKQTEIKAFIGHINSSDVDAFCLMDYWTFDWYIELQDYIKANPDELKKTIFPGMELRIESPTSYRLNIHVILSDNLTKQELVDFKSELNIRSIDKKLSDDALIKFAKTLDAAKARNHSYGDPATLDDPTLWELGSRTAEITKESLQAAFDQIPKNSGFILLPYDTSDGLLKLDWDKHPHADNYFMQSAHIFEARDARNIDLFNGTRTTDNETFFDNFTKTLGNKFKPCVSGSDAHRFADYGKYPSERITWIKADPTFEGLKQIIFEPKSRVRIQGARPEQKEQKLIIDSVRFISADGKFNPEPIYLNENLNVIIGGKSSGKSILLYNIARTLLADKEFFNKAKIEDRYKFQKDDPAFNFEITTKGGFSQLMYRDVEENSVLPQIKYIPQNYLVQLAEPDENKTGDALNKIVRDLIIENSEARENYESFITKLKANDRKRESLIDNYFEIEERITGLENQLLTKSKKEILENNIDANNKTVKELNEAAGLTPAEIEKYDKLQLELGKLTALRNSLASDFKRITEFNKDFESTLATLKNKEKLLVESLESKEFKVIYQEESKTLDHAFQLLAEFNEKFFVVPTEGGPSRFKVASDVSKIITGTVRRIKEIGEELLPYLKNDELKKQIEVINKSIVEDKAAVHAIDQINKEIAGAKKTLAGLKEQIFNLYQSSYAEYEAIIEELKSRTVDLEKDGLKIEGLTKFNFSKFRKAVFDFSNGRQANYRAYNICDEEKQSLDSYVLTDLITDLKNMFESIVEKKEYALISRFDRKAAAEMLLDDYFFDYWEIEYKNDKLGEMSTGKASFVILMLIVGLSTSKAPILIDQPEDNLDNRSITADLVEYLREKKIERQIILVTHNPNIVVNADAENIIIANQQGQNEIETSSKYQFDYINGSLENSSRKDESEKDLLKCMGIREHIADIIEGGQEAFKKREEKYGFSEA